MKFHRFSISKKIILMVVLVLLLSNSIICAVSISVTRVSIRRSIQQRMLDIANCAAGSVNGDILANIAAEDMGTPEYEEVLKSLAVFRDNVELKYVYGIKDEGDGVFTFTVDPAIDDPATFGDTVKYTPALAKASKGIPSVDEVPYEDLWGRFYSAYSPVFDSAGNVAGIIGTDFSVDWFNSQLKRQTLASVIIFIAVLIVTLLVIIPVAYFMIGNITESLRHMTWIAKKYEEGDYSEDIIVMNNDEVGELSHSLQNMARSLVEQIEKANNANKAKSDFFSNMSHELRTPINVLMGMNDNILRETREKSTREYASNIKVECRALLAMVNELLSFSKIEKGEAYIETREYDAKAMITDLLRFGSARSKTKNLTFKYDVDESIPVSLYGDDVSITHIIGNLLSNAVKYTKEGSITLSIKEAGRKEGAIFLEVVVDDTGIGLTEDELSHIGSTFDRLEGVIKHDFEGIGLDIDVVDRLLKMMGSRLEVKSEYGKGSSFSFRLRQGIYDNKAMGSILFSDNNVSEAPRKDKFTNYAGSSVLVVDDYDMNLKVVKDLLSNYGIEPDLALSGVEAIDRVKTKAYDLILLDHMMPKPNGIEVLHILHEEGIISEATRVVALTANAVDGAKEMYLEAGFDDYIPKPIETDVLSSVLFKFLRPAAVKQLDIDVVLEFEPKQKSDEEPVTDELDKLKAIGLDTDAAMKYCAGKTAFYYEMLKDLANDYDKKHDELEAAYLDGDFERFRITVHALKSLFKTLGAQGLSDKAKDLEDAAKKIDVFYINEHKESFFSDYEKLVTDVRSILNS